MAASILRSASRLSSISFRFIALRSITTSVRAPIFKLNVVSNSPASFLSHNLNKRYYSGDVKFNADQVEVKIMEILTNFDRVKENPSHPKVTLESHLSKDLGLDSLDQVEIIVQLEDTFGYEIPDSDYEKLMTPQEMIKYIQKRLVEI